MLTKIEKILNERRFRYLYGLLVVLTFSFSLMSQRNQREIRDVASGRDLQRQVRFQMQLVSSTIKEAEANHRGYLLTGLDGYLDGYNRSQADWSANYHLLQSMLGSAPQVARLERLRLSVEDLFKSMGSSLAKRQVEGDSDFQSIVTIDGILREMKDAQQADMDAQSARIDLLMQTSQRTLTLLAVLFLLIVGLNFWSARRRRLERVAAERSLRTAQEEIDLMRAQLSKILDTQFAKPELEIAPLPAYAAFRVLLVDDNPVNHGVLQPILEHHGYFVKTALNGAEAMALVEKSHFDLILMDVEMPEMDGYEATRRIRALSNAVKSQVPIIAITGYDEEGAKDLCLAAGMTDFLAKPFNPKELLALVEKHISRSTRKVA
jgi:CheY-like chemotaxis protein/CHASE3 domain sensor protein